MKSSLYPGQVENIKNKIQYINQYFGMYSLITANKMTLSLQKYEFLINITSFNLLKT